MLFQQEIEGSRRIPDRAGAAGRRWWRRSPATRGPHGADSSAPRWPRWHGQSRWRRADRPPGVGRGFDVNRKPEFAGQRAEGGAAIGGVQERAGFAVLDMDLDAAQLMAMGKAQQVKRGRHAQTKVQMPGIAMGKRRIASMRCTRRARSAGLRAAIGRLCWFMTMAFAHQVITRNRPGCKGLVVGLRGGSCASHGGGVRAPWQGVDRRGGGAGHRAGVTFAEGARFGRGRGMRENLPRRWLA